MRVAITGASGLAAAIAGALQDCSINHVRIEDIMDCDWVWEENDVFINCAHLGFDQTKLLHQAYEAWQKDSSKYIINISSRAAQPNIFHKDTCIVHKKRVLIILLIVLSIIVTSNAV